MENVVAFEIARAALEKFAGDTMREVRAAYASYLRLARELGSDRAQRHCASPQENQSEA
jgi:hypothetical protein